LGFENAEFYIKRWPELDGMRFGDVLISFPDAVPCGVKLASKGGKILMNPADDYVLREGDEVLVIAEDDDTYAPAPLAEVIFLSSTSGCIIFTLCTNYHQASKSYCPSQSFYFASILINITFW
jgi:hypothetical protein